MKLLAVADVTQRNKHHGFDNCASSVNIQEEEEEEEKKKKKEEEEEEEQPA
jgi:hypothetical protein